MYGSTGTGSKLYGTCSTKYRERSIQKVCMELGVSVCLCIVKLGKTSKRKQLAAMNKKKKNPYERSHDLVLEVYTIYN